MAKKNFIPNAFTLDKDRLSFNNEKWKNNLDPVYKDCCNAFIDEVVIGYRLIMLSIR